MASSKPKVLLSDVELKNRIRELGSKISNDYRGSELVVVGVLKGSFVFLADLIRRLDLAGVIVEFITVSSYEGDESLGKVSLAQDMKVDIRGRHVLVVEDIVDTGLTWQFLRRHLEKRGPESLKLCSLLSKPCRRTVEADVDYLGFEIEDLFVVGYGLDYDQKLRELPYIGIF